MSRFASATLSIALLLPAALAQAASLTVTPDKSFYLLGETVTLSIVGDSMDAADDAIYGELLFDETLVTPLGASQNPLTSLGGALPWTEGIIGSSDPGSVVAFNQLQATGPYPVDQLLLATVTFTVDDVGEMDFQWAGNLDFFGLTDAPGTTIPLIPEPSTAALLTLGLLGLTVRRGRAVPR